MEKIEMNKTKRLVVGVFFVLAASLFMGAIFEKSEAKLKVIKAGVDENGYPVCVNKSQVYLFKKDQGKNKIVFFYHDAQSPEASVTKSFSDSESLDSYWEDLLKNW
ncbi:MAG TPA: hypothetical protein DCX67_02535 [Opitutae bacterium]|nr:hypothetical protein [Opitutae bacterium]|tara:strand:+ start:226 stop:543 length:318 start_codon:yes stop_codon:yes gene_type:complete